MSASEGILLISAVAATSGLGAALYLKVPHQRWRRRAAAQAVLGYGVLLSLALTLAFHIVHLHQLVTPTIHFHDLPVPIPHVHTLLAAEIHVHDAVLALGDTGVAGAALAAAAAGLSAPLLAFLTSQASLRALLRELRAKEDRAASRRLKELTGLRGAQLLVVEEATADAFCFALLRFRLAWGLPRAENFVVVTRELVRRLPPDELVAAVMHEAGHMRALDGRYAPFLRTLRRIVFFDPVFRRFVRRVEEEQEFEADRWAAASTGRPLSLARALLDTHEIALRLRGPAAAHFAGKPCLLEERVRRLVELHEELLKAMAAPGRRGPAPS